MGAILTQHASWTGAEQALARLRRRLGRLSWPGLLALPRVALERALRPAGCFRQKARKLRALALAATCRGGSIRSWLGSGRVAQRRKELLGVWGIGPETADKILLYAADRPSLVLDAYGRRIGERLGWELGRSYASARGFLLRRLPKARRLYAENHALLVRLAKEHCRAAPACRGCPVRAVCAHGRSQPLNVSPEH